MTRITGVVRNSQGKPLSAARLALRSRTQAGGGFMRMLCDRSVPMGGSRSPLRAARRPFTSKSCRCRRDAGVERGPELDEFASVPITAGGRDIADLVITTSTWRHDLRGQVTFRRRDTVRKSRARRCDVSRSERCGIERHFPRDRRQRRDRRERALSTSRCHWPHAPDVHRVPLCADGGTTRRGWGLKSVTFNGAEYYRHAA